MKKAIVAVIIAAVAIMSGCSLLPGRGGNSSGGFLFGDKEHSDKYKSAEEYCEYWFGPCEEVDSYVEEGVDYDRTVHVMKDKEFGFEYTVSESKEGYFLFSGNFAYYYIDEFLKSDGLKDISKEYGLLWSAPWEKDKKTKALYHVENDTFGDNYKEQ